MRGPALLSCSFLLSACFAPRADVDSGSGSSDTDAASTGAAGSSSGAGTSTGGDPTTGSEDESTSGPATGTDTAAADDPPVFESFTVNGSDAPPEVSEGGTILLEAEVTDDLGVASVEFFDGDATLGVVDEAPYELEVPVSSADSGAHSYTAVATDTSDQSTESDAVSLSVNIVGGEVLFYREDLFRSTYGLGGPGVSIAATQGGRILVNGLIADTIGGRIQAFNDDLSSLWIANEDGLIRAPAVDLGDEVVVSSWVDGEWRYTLRTLASSSVAGEVSVNVPIGDPIVTLVGSRAVRGGEGLVLTTAPNSLRSYSEDLSSAGWSLDLPADVVVSDLDPTAGGAILISFNATLNGDSECVTGSQSCLRRVEADGSTDWTVGVPGNGAAAVRSDGSVLHVSAGQSSGLAYIEYDQNGEVVVSESLLDEDRTYFSTDDVAADGLDGFVLAGTLDPSDDRTAVVSRYDQSGERIWDQDALANGPDSMGLGVSVFEDAAYVCGIETLETSGLGVEGDVFAAKLRL